MHQQDPSSGTTGTTTPSTTITITTDAGARPSPPRALYFAYGSNLSFSQMRMRCTFNPDLSSRPVAIARLDHWRWLICQPGYANVVPPSGLRVGHQTSEGDEVPISGEEDTVYGVLYEMDAADEKLLDGYEGVDWEAPLARRDEKVPVTVRPREQGRGHYNKWYVEAKVTRWLDEEQRKKWENSKGPQTTVLVYVDEKNVRVAGPRPEYIHRMNRAMREAETIRFPKKWTDEVMRRFIPSK